MPDNIVPITGEAKVAAQKYIKEHGRELLTILFTDLVDSTQLQSDLGNVEAARITEVHRELVRDELAKYDAREIEWAGDSCLAVFTKPSDAVVFALRMQAEHRRVRETEKRLPKVRVGMHLGEIVVKKGPKKEDLFGLQVSEAARVMSIARGNQIFCTRAVFDSARGSLKGQTIEGIGDAVWVNYGAYLLKGSEEPIEICEIGSADVAVMKAPEANDKVYPVVPGGTMTKSTGTPKWAMAILVLLLVGVSILAGSFALGLIGGDGGRGRASNVEAPIRSLAVLPFENQSGDSDQEYFVDGMTGALTSELSKIASIKVIGRASAMHYKDTDKSPREIAEELGVDGLITGSAYQSENEVRITAELMHAATQTTMWSNNYDDAMENVLKLHSKVALDISTEISATLSEAEKSSYASTKGVNPAAYDLYLQARALMGFRTEEALGDAIALFDRVVAIDPDFAPAYAGLADCHALNASYDYSTVNEARGPFEAYAAKAIALDNNSSEAHLSSAEFLKKFTTRWVDMEREYRRAIELNPNSAQAYAWYGEFLAYSGRHSEALVATKRAVELDPASAQFRTARGNVYYLVRDFDEAARYLDEALALDPVHPWALDLRSQVHMLEGEYDSAIDIVANYYDREKLITLIKAFAGDAVAARAFLEGIDEDSGDESHWRVMNILNLHAALGDVDAAIEWLDRAISFASIELRINPLLDPLREDPRYWAFIDTLDLPPLPPEHPLYAKEQAYLRQKAAEAALDVQPKPVMRFTITSPVDVVGGPVLSPDGSRFVYVGEENGLRMLYERRLDGYDSEIHVMEGTEGAENPFFSPDGEWLAFMRGSELLKRRMSNGVVEVLSKGLIESSQGTWNKEGTIILGNTLSGLWRIDVSTGASEIFLQPDIDQEVYGSFSPAFLPDGKHLIFTGTRGVMDESGAITSILSLDDLTTRTLFTGGSDARYTSTGHLVYRLGSDLWAAPFDLESPGQSVKSNRIVEDVSSQSSFSLSHTGHLAYLQGGILAADLNTHFVWVNRDGTPEEFTKETEEYAFPDVSPDGRRVVMTVGPRGGNRNWIVDVVRSTSFPLVADNPNNALPVWSPQGDWIAFVGKSGDIYRIRPTPDAKPELVLSGIGSLIPTSWSPDGAEIVFTRAPLSELDNIKIVNVNTQVVRDLVTTEGADIHGRVSPNGDWLAYATNFSGKREVWIQPYPYADPGSAMQISSTTSRDPVWSNDGSELFMLQDDNQAMWSVKVPKDNDTEWGIPEKLFDFEFEIQDRGPEVRCYDVAPDGRFIFSTAPVMLDGPEANSREIRIVLNAFEEIKRLAPHLEGK